MRARAHPAARAIAEVRGARGGIGFILDVPVRVENRGVVEMATIVVCGPSVLEYGCELYFLRHGEIDTRLEGEEDMVRNWYESAYHEERCAGRNLGSLPLQIAHTDAGKANWDDGPEA